MGIGLISKLQNKPLEAAYTLENLNYIDEFEKCCGRINLPTTELLKTVLSECISHHSN